MDLLLLPPEILFEIFQHLDYQGLINIRRTCKALYGVMNSEPFWTTLARDLCSKPGIGKLTYPLGNYSTIELMRWTLRRLRVRERWASDDNYYPFRFHSRLIGGCQNLYGAELLRGGRWLFTMRLDGTAYILDLEKESPRPQFLFDSGPLVKFRIWIDETKPELLFRVAMHPGGTSRKGPVYIYQIHCVGQDSSTPLVVTHITIIQDSRPGVRSWSTLSERFFLQCFALPGENGQEISTSLQLHSCSQDLLLPYDASDYVETRVETNGLTRAFFVPGDRVVFAASTFINIYAISIDQDSTLPRLELLHYVPILQTASLLSMPFMGSHSTFFVSIHQGAFRRITINDNNPSSPPVIEELGQLKTLTMLSSDVIFGPSASIVRPQSWSKHASLEIVTYEYGVDRESFRRKGSNLTNDLPLPARYLAGFDDSVGRIVFRADSSQDQFMVLDLI